MVNDQDASKATAHSTSDSLHPVMAGLEEVVVLAFAIDSAAAAVWLVVPHVRTILLHIG